MLGSNVYVRVFENGSVALNLFSAMEEKYEEILLTKLFLEKVLPALSNRIPMELDNLQFLQHLGDWHAMLVLLSKDDDVIAVRKCIDEVAGQEDLAQAVCDAGRASVEAMSEAASVCKAWYRNWPRIRKKYNI